MPGVPPPNSTSFQYMLASMQNRIGALERQQQLVISNLQGQPVIVLGLQPGSNPPKWGFGVLRKTFRQVAAFFGEDQTGTVILSFTGPTGASQDIFPVSSHFHKTTLTTTSTTPVSLPTSPTVTAIIGKSGDALVTISAFIGMTPNPAESSISLTIDGTLHGQWCAASASASRVGLNSSTVRRLSDQGITLTKGSHTFALKYTSSKSTTTAQFSAIGLVVQPL